MLVIEKSRSGEPLFFRFMPIGAFTCPNAPLRFIICVHFLSTNYTNEHEFYVNTNEFQLC